MLYGVCWTVGDCVGGDGGVVAVRCGPGDLDIVEGYWGTGDGGELHWVRLVWGGGITLMYTCVTII